MGLADSLTGSNMFIGEYQHTIDEKRRMSIPAKFREELGNKGVLTKGLEGCLFLYPYEEWRQLAERLSQLPVSQADARSFSRIMLAGAMEASIDNLGRILIPDYLREYAGLEKRAVVAGLFSRIEIWDEERWEQYKAQTQEEVGDIAERLKELGI